MNHYSVLEKPILSEKADEAREHNQYTFRIHKNASKTDVKKALQKVYGVKVEKVATHIRRLKKPRQGLLFSGKVGTEKRAIVTLKEGETLSFFNDL